VRADVVVLADVLDDDAAEMPVVEQLKISSNASGRRPEKMEALATRPHAMSSMTFPRRSTRSRAERFDVSSESGIPRERRTGFTGRQISA